VVIRIVDRDAGVRSLDEIGMSAEKLRALRAAVRQPNGIFLVTGPTGSGKSTTLYGVLAELVADHRNISTIEDPVERVIRGVNQFQVHPKSGFTFARALRAMLRQDPDVIMVGEIRDPETAKLATEAALTGHLVLSTLHTNDAPTSVPRLINMGVEPYLVAATLRGALAQRLVRRLCPNCSVSRPLSEAQIGALRRMCGGDSPIASASRGEGCDECSGAGTRGRIGVFDLLLLDETKLTSLAGANTLKDMQSCDRARGLLHDGLEKVRSRLISIDTLLEIVSQTEEHDPQSPLSQPSLNAA
jgi:type II secretory ATPase GspE/PulE/Tfp pilus assembly ATPase PilB-like protein